MNLERAIIGCLIGLAVYCFYGGFDRETYIVVVEGVNGRYVTTDRGVMYSRVAVDSDSEYEVEVRDPLIGVPVITKVRKHDR
jgi:hypothetical protein